MFENIIEKLGLKPENVKPENELALSAAVILLEIAYSDEDFSDEERAIVVSILQEDFKLSNEDIDAILRTGEEILQNDTNKWRYIDMINSSYSQDKKQLLLEKFWTVIYADGKLDKHEDYLVHKISSMLHIPHNVMIDIKLKVKNK